MYALHYFTKRSLARSMVVVCCWIGAFVFVSTLQAQEGSDGFGLGDAYEDFLDEKTKFDAPDSEDGYDSEEFYGEEELFEDYSEEEALKEKAKAYLKEYGFMHPKEKLQKDPNADAKAPYVDSEEQGKQVSKPQRITVKSIEKENSVASEAVVAQLAKQVKLEFYDTPLMDVIEVLRDHAGMNMIIDAKAFEEEGISIDVPVTLQVSGISLESALELILSPLDCTWYVHRGLLMITTLTVEETTQFVRIYDISPLLDKQASLEERIHYHEQLGNIIKQTIHPDRWIEVGGNSSLMSWKNTFVMNASPKTHERVQTLLNTLYEISQEEKDK
ncbi:Hypothetical protein PBC10988_15110 [Planctomycetales bacterium 10988]|nr:Hypothetical protein PBC10988_15110 [Planctomycetales bacterium 10988]